MKQRVKTILFIGLALIALFGMTGCPNAAKPEEPPAPPSYTPVAFAKLANYLQKLPEGDSIHKIEVTGLTKDALQGNGQSHTPNPSPLGAILKANPTKKVALKLGGGITGLTDMSYCFARCENLVSAAAIPKGVTNLERCFKGCKNLVSVANIPSGVLDMKDCFYGCIRLKTAPVIPYGVLQMSYCFKGCKSLISVTLKCGCTPYFFEDTFKDCDALGVGSIKVPKLAYNQFTTAEALNKMAVPGATEAEKRAKFVGLAELNP